MTIATSPFLPLVMNCLVPLMTYSSPSRTAVVRSAAASLPVCGSVSAKAPSISPCASGRSHCSFLRVVRVHHRDRAYRAVVDRDDGRGAAVAGRDLFQHQRQRHVVEARAAQLLRAPPRRRRPAPPAPSARPSGNAARGPSARRWAPGAPAKSCAGRRGSSGVLRSVSWCRVVIVVFGGLPGNRRAVVVQEAAVGWQVSAGQGRAQARTLCSTSASAPAPPMSVCTQPGWKATQVTPCGPKSSARRQHRVQRRLAGAVQRARGAGALADRAHARGDHRQLAARVRHQRRDDRQQAHRRQHVGVHDGVEFLLGREAVVARAVHAGHQPGVVDLLVVQFPAQAGDRFGAGDVELVRLGAELAQFAVGAACGRWRSRASRRRGTGAPVRGRCRARRR
jgi:hypothetical protein